MIRQFRMILHRLRKGYLNERNFLFLSSILVGVLVGIAAFWMKTFVLGIESALIRLQRWADYEWLLLLFPLIGILISVLIVQKLWRGVSGSGVSSIIYSVSKRSGNLASFNMYRQFFHGIITVGFGGSVGLEAPIAVTGSAIGSNLARFLLLSPKERIVLIACGAASGIAAVFNAPVAGVLFAMEVLLTEFTIPTFIPVLISAATGAVVARELGGSQLFSGQLQDWKMDAVPFYLLLGSFCGFMSVYFARTHFALEGWIQKVKSPFQKALGGGLVLGVLVFIFPPLYGEGYDIINDLLHGNVNAVLVESHLPLRFLSDYVLIFLVVAILFVKVFATSFTISSGGGGGVFAPSLFTGAFAGLSFSLFFKFLGIKDLNMVNFVAAGMAGLLSGVVHAPLTAIFLIAELTGGYTLFVPLMMVSATSYFISRAFEPFSIYTSKLARRGIRVDDRESVILQGIALSDIMVIEVPHFKPSNSLRELIEGISQTQHSIFPVLTNKKLEGLVNLEELKPYFFKSELFDTLEISEIMNPAIGTISAEQDDMKKVMKKFDESGLLFLPVVNESEIFIGFASKTLLLSQLRRSMSRHQLDFK